MTMSCHNECVVCGGEVCEDEECDIVMLQNRKHRTLREVFEACHATSQLARIRPNRRHECLQMLLRFRNQLKEMRKHKLGF